MVPAKVGFSRANAIADNRQRETTKRSNALLLGPNDGRPLCEHLLRGVVVSHRLGGPRAPKPCGFGGHRWASDSASFPRSRLAARATGQNLRPWPPSTPISAGPDPANPNRCLSRTDELCDEGLRLLAKSLPIFRTLAGSGCCPPLWIPTATSFPPGSIF